MTRKITNAIAYSGYVILGLFFVVIVFNVSLDWLVGLL